MLLIIYVVSVGVELRGLTGGGQRVEAVLWVGGGITMAEKSLLAPG